MIIKVGGGGLEPLGPIGVYAYGIARIVSTRPIVTNGPMLRGRSMCWSRHVSLVKWSNSSRYRWGESRDSVGPGNYYYTLTSPGEYDGPAFPTKKAL